jgi:hypothetical protein
MADTASTSPYRTSGSATASYDLVTWVDGSVPRSAPAALFSTERYDPSGGDEMVWNLPVPPGRHVRVRLYLSDRCPCTYTAGKRVFDVTLDGTTVLNDWDANAMVGHNTATVRSFDVTSDGSITIGFIHQVENPTVDAIEVIDLDANPVSPTPMPWIAHRSFDGATAGGRVQRSSSIDWSRARGIFFTNGSVYYGWDDGKMYRRTFNGSTFGGSKLVATDDLSPSHFPIPSVTGMFLQDGRLYYTVQGDDRLYYRYFELGGNRVGAVTFVADGPGSAFDWGSVRGVTLAGGTLFLARANGTLWSADWEPGLEHGTPVSASLALVDDDPSQGWASRGLFVQNP